MARRGNATSARGACAAANDDAKARRGDSAEDDEGTPGGGGRERKERERRGRGGGKEKKGCERERKREREMIDDDCF